MGVVLRVPAAEKPPELVYHAHLECYECLGCGEMEEVPYRVVLDAGHEPVDVKRHPENRLLWLELVTLDHARCHLYKDERKAREARENAHARARRRLFALRRPGPEMA